jgi:tetratricopeptide (TPR) repeat protein
MVCLFATAFLATSRRAVAQSNEAHADELFRQGQALLQGGRLPEACARLGDSLRLDPALGTLLNLALCHEREGRLATAHREYAVAAMWAGQRRERDRERFAKERVDALEGRLSKVRLEIVPARPALKVKLDGSLLDAAQLEEDIAVDPGTHRLEVTGEGRRTWSRRDLWIDLPGTIVVRLALDELPSDGPPAALRARGADVERARLPAPAADVDAPRHAPAGSPLLSYVVGGTGVASLGVGIALLLRAAALDGESDREAERARTSTPPDPASKAKAMEHHGDAITNQNVGLAAAGVGVLGVSASLYLLLSGHHMEPSTAPRAMQIAPRIAPNIAGLQLEGRF